ncbi:hypothetical protein, partial [Escherichia coli]
MKKSTLSLAIGLLLACSTGMAKIQLVPYTHL